MAKPVIQDYINLQQLRKTTWTTTATPQKLYSITGNLQRTASFIANASFDVWTTKERKEEYIIYFAIFIITLLLIHNNILYKEKGKKSLLIAL